MAKLVYVEVLGKPFPEKWPHDIPDNGKRRSVPIFEREILAHEEKMSLNDLAKSYPLPPPVKNE